MIDEHKGALERKLISKTLVDLQNKIINRKQTKCKKFHLNARKKLFTVRIIKQWTGFPREAVEPLSLEIHKTQWDMVLDNLLGALA